MVTLSFKQCLKEVSNLSRGTFNQDFLVLHRAAACLFAIIRLALAASNMLLQQLLLILTMLIACA